MFTERSTWSRVWWLVLLSPAIIEAAVAILFLVAPPRSGQATGLVILGVVAIGCLALAYGFRALDLTIDDHELRVGFPLVHERVSLDQIVACRPIRYRWWEFGGYGVRWGWRGKMYNVGGDGGHAVELTRRGRGSLLFSSREPEAVCAAIQTRRPDVISN